MRPDEALHVLGVSATASPAEVKAAYRRLVKAWHPDRQGGDEQRRAAAEDALKRVLDAYRCLKAGVPPAGPPADSPQKEPTAASMFSVRPAPPLRGHRVRRAYGQRLSRRLRYRRSVVLLLTGLGVVVALAATWPKGEPLPQERPPLEPLHPIKVRATRTGRDWSMVNLSNRTWFRCRAWVGAKMLDIPSIEAGQTLVLKGSTFDPRLSEIDDERELDVLCAR